VRFDARAISNVIEDSIHRQKNFRLFPFVDFSSATARDAAIT
jgi:hypothetical protein